MELIAEFPSPQMTFLPKTEKPGERMGRLPFIQFPPHPTAVLLIVQGLEDVDRLVSPANLRQRLMDAVLSRVGAQSVQDERGGHNSILNGGDHTHGLIPRLSYEVCFNGTGQDGIQIRKGLLAVHLIERLILDVFDPWSQIKPQQSCRRHDDFGIAMGVGITDGGIEFGIVLQ